ncbi:MAG: ATP-binding protein [Candidatus Methanoperedens sp.]|nr:ATP-binding protein [Candidatus Methanoperedens sp.]
MAKDSIGIIFGKTGSLNFRFAVSDSTSARKSDYLKVWHESDGWTLAQVSTITRSSDDFSLEEAVNVAEGISKVRNMEEQIIAEAAVIGSRDRTGKLTIPKSPFSPGDKVFRADETLIKQTLGLIRGDVYVGMLDGQDIKVNLEANNLVQKHCSILAKTGSGKSYTCGVILEELLDKEVPLLIIDPHGEYATLKYPNDDKTEAFERFGIEPKGYEDRVTVYTPANKTLNPGADMLFRLNGTNLGTKDIRQLFPDERAQNQSGILFEAISKLKEERDTYTIDDIIYEVGQDKSKVKWNVINMLESLNETGILSDNATTVYELVREGHASIIDMKGVNPDLQQMIVARLCSDLFEARKLNEVPPCMLVIEEAHNYCPEKGFDKTVSTDILRTIASEGRKFGLGLMVVSQRPARVDKNILSQCNTQIIMKVTNPNDLKAISKGLENMSSNVEEDIKRLSPGVAMIVSNYIERPIHVDIRSRKSKHGGASVPVVRTSFIEKIRDPQPERKKITQGMRNITSLLKLTPDEKKKETIKEKMENTEEIEEKERKKELLEQKKKKKEPEEQNKKTGKTKKNNKSLYSKMFGSRKK